MCLLKDIIVNLANPFGRCTRQTYETEEIIKYTIIIGKYTVPGNIRFRLLFRIVD